MNKLVKSFIYLLFLGLLSCENEGNVKFRLDSFDSDKYYTEEILPDVYQKMYGKWKLYDVSGGFSGSGHEPDYDYLELRSAGIYGLVRNDSLFEYGKIVLDTFDINTQGFLQIRLVPEYHYGKTPYMYSPQIYVEFKDTDTLSLISPCCDLYNYHHKRIK